MLERFGAVLASGTSGALFQGRRDYNCQPWLLFAVFLSSESVKLASLRGKS